jgi:hypothetical protein
MPAEQTILMTVIPRAVTVSDGRANLPISLFITPRLRGAGRLGAFPDWVHWTQRVVDHGLRVRLSTTAGSAAIAVDTGLLEPRLWSALFDAETLVRSHTFDDYTGKPILSYSVRDALGVLKSIYQQAAIDLALPDTGIYRERSLNRARLESLVRGLEVRWDDDEAAKWRDRMRSLSLDTRPPVRDPAALDREGVPLIAPGKADVALPFAVFHHMPTPPYDAPLGEDWENYLDFHQVLASLNAYPALQRALGLVFDLELRPDVVAITPGGGYELLSVEVLDPGVPWAVATTVPPLQTAYLRTVAGGREAFLAAPRRLVEPDSPLQIVGLLDLDPTRFGLAQVDVDGGMHKAIMLAETTYPDPDVPRNLNDEQPAAAANPEVFDPAATLASLRSAGITLYADGRAQVLLDTIARSKTLNDAAEGGPQVPFFAEDLVRGYRLDVWDSRTTDWHSLHLRTEEYSIGSEPFRAATREGFVQLAATQQAPGAEPAATDLYLHEAIARWAGWSLSAPVPGKHLSRYADAARAVPPDGADGDYSVNQPLTPFKVSPTFTVVPGSLPLLRFGTCYRVRARAVDLAGNSFALDDPIADTLSAELALPRDVGGAPYLRFEPVPAPLVVVRDQAAITGAGSDLRRLVMRTFNGSPELDTVPADVTAADRHLLPPRTSVELGERLGMFDDAAGKLKSDAATWQLISDRDAGELPREQFVVAGQPKDVPLVAAATIDAIPYLPDALSRAVAIRDLPGTPGTSIGSASAGSGAIQYSPLDDPNPRAGSATIVPFPGADDWQNVKGIRLALAEQADPAPQPPSWDADARVLTVYLAKGESATVPLSSFVRAEDLRLLGQWQWLAEQVARTAAAEPVHERLLPGFPVDAVAQVVQRTLEGGHWLITPPTLLTLVHAVQQPLGRPSFTALNVRDPSPWLGAGGTVSKLMTAPTTGRADPTELAPITAYRELGSTDAFLIGALRVHGVGTAKVDLLASWTDPDDIAVADHAAHADEIPLPRPVEGYLSAPSGDSYRDVGYYDPEHDQIAFVRAGEWAGRLGPGGLTFDHDAAPRHALGDTKRHRITYTAVATSRFTEYFPPDAPGGFTRTGSPVLVDVPASAPPLVPDVLYIVPTFGWQRQVATNVMRSVRFGGGLRVYLKRPWFSSGEGELLGVALWNQSVTIDQEAREKLKPYVTQWGMDPVWETASLSGVPGVASFPDADASGFGLPLVDGDFDIDVVGFAPQFDYTRGLWFADLTVDTGETYMPFVRLALVRFQPHALVGAQLSRVVLADFAQLAPDRTATATFDPYNPRVINVAVSGVSPRGPGTQRTEIEVRVQEYDRSIGGDVGWADVTADVAVVDAATPAPVSPDPDLTLWAGTIVFATDPQPGMHRLLITEQEVLPTYSDVPAAPAPSRLVYAETFVLGVPGDGAVGTTEAPVVPAAEAEPLTAVVIVGPTATAEQRAAVLQRIESGGGTVALGLGTYAAAVFGDQSLLSSLANMAGVSAVVTTDADVPAGLDDDTDDLVHAWLATLDPAFRAQLADPTRYGRSWGTVESGEGIT